MYNNLHSEHAARKAAARVLFGGGRPTRRGGSSEHRHAGPGTRATFDLQETAVNNANDATTSTKNEVHAFDHAGKKESAPSALPRRRQRPSGRHAMKALRLARRTEAVREADPPIDIDIQVSDSLLGEGARRVHLLVEDEPYFNVDLGFIATEGPAAWPTRFHGNLQQSATVLRMLLSEDSRLGATVSKAACFLKHVEENGNSTLTQLRDGACNCLSNAAPWETR